MAPSRSRSHVSGALRRRRPRRSSEGLGRTDLRRQGRLRVGHGWFSRGRKTAGRRTRGAARGKPARTACRSTLTRLISTPGRGKGPLGYDGLGDTGETIERLSPLRAVIARGTSICLAEAVGTKVHERFRERLGLVQIRGGARARGWHRHDCSLSRRSGNRVRARETPGRLRNSSGRHGPLSDHRALYLALSVLRRSAGVVSRSAREYYSREVMNTFSFASPGATIVGWIGGHRRARVRHDRLPASSGERVGSRRVDGSRTSSRMAGPGYASPTRTASLASGAASPIVRRRDLRARSRLPTRTGTTPTAHAA